MSESPQSNEDETILPITPELIEKIIGIDDHGLNRAQKREHNRLVAGLRSKRQSGVIVTVVHPDESVRFYQVKQFIIGPAE